MGVDEPVSALREHCDEDRAVELELVPVESRALVVHSNPTHTLTIPGENLIMMLCNPDADHVSATPLAGACTAPRRPLSAALGTRRSIFRLAVSLCHTRSLWVRGPSVDGTPHPTAGRDLRLAGGDAPRRR